MVQLHENRELWEKEGLTVVGISYDPPEVLKRFAQASGIEFPLLSDQKSEVIDAYGVRNREVSKGRYDGIPHPVTFLIDRELTVRTKLGREGYRQRHEVEELAEAARRLDSTPNR